MIMRKVTLVLLTLFPLLSVAKMSDAEWGLISSSINQELREMGLSNKALSCRIFNHSNPSILVYEYSGSLLDDQNAFMMASKFKSDFAKNLTTEERRVFKKGGYKFIQFKVKNKTTNLTL